MRLFGEISEKSAIENEANYRIRQAISYKTNFFEKPMIHILMIGEKDKFFETPEQGKTSRHAPDCDRGLSQALVAKKGRIGEDQVELLSQASIHLRVVD